MNVPQILVVAAPTFALIRSCLRCASAPPKAMWPGIAEETMIVPGLSSVLPHAGAKTPMNSMTTSRNPVPQTETAAAPSFANPGYVGEFCVNSSDCAGSLGCDSQNGRNPGKGSLAVVGAGIGGAVVLLSLCVCFCCWKRRKSKRQEETSNPNNIAAPLRPDSSGNDASPVAQRNIADESSSNTGGTISAPSLWPCVGFALPNHHVSPPAGPRIPGARLIKLLLRRKSCRATAREYQERVYREQRANWPAISKIRRQFTAGIRGKR